MNLARVDLIKQSHQHKSIEYHSEVDSRHWTHKVDAAIYV